MSDLMKACVECGEVTNESRCPEHRYANPYDAAWRRLSRKARKLQPFCQLCGNTDELQLDHTPQAWDRWIAGKKIRLADVRVLCGPCNRDAGQAKPGAGRRKTRGIPPTNEAADTPDSDSRLHTGPLRAGVR